MYIRTNKKEEIERDRGQKKDKKKVKEMLIGQKDMHEENGEGVWEEPGGYESLRRGMHGRTCMGPLEGSTKGVRVHWGMA